jgi:hypothetical protein
MRSSAIPLLAVAFLASTLLGCGGGGEGADAPDATTETPASAPADEGDFQTHTGDLTSSDRTLESGEFADVYPVDVRTGQNVTVEVNTDGTLDPYLILRAPSEQQVDNDDYNGSRTQSRIEHAAAETGEYDVIVTSYQPGETGPYTLTIRVE